MTCAQFVYRRSVRDDPAGAVPPGPRFVIADSGAADGVGDAMVVAPPTTGVDASPGALG